MKHILFFGTLVISLLTSTTSKANVYVANNNITSPGQYTTLQSAIDAAQDGDTIHIQPSNIIYDNNNFNGFIAINKSLTLIGVGHNPKKDIPYGSSISQLRLSGTACSVGTTIIGVKMGTLSMACGQPVYNLHISHCDLTTISSTYEPNCFSPTGYYNAVVENSLIGSIGLNGMSVGDNIIFNNDIFYSYQHHFGSFSNVIVKNCLFLYFHSDTSIQGNAVTFENNIFYRTGPNSTNIPGLTNCVFNNNITYLTQSTELIFGSNTGSNNIIAQDPLFVQYTDGTGYSSASNFRLNALSPGHNAGTDGTDIGLYGANNTFSETGEHPDLPVVRVMNIDNMTVPSQGNINVHVKVTTAKSDNP